MSDVEWFLGADMRGEKSGHVSTVFEYNGSLYKFGGEGYQPRTRFKLTPRCSTCYLEVPLMILREGKDNLTRKEWKTIKKVLKKAIKRDMSENEELKKIADERKDGKSIPVKFEEL